MILVWGTHTHMDHKKLPVHTWAAHKCMGLPLHVWAKYSYGMEHTYVHIIISDQTCKNWKNPTFMEFCTIAILLSTYFKEYVASIGASMWST